MLVVLAAVATAAAYCSDDDDDDDNVPQITCVNHSCNGNAACVSQSVCFREQRMCFFVCLCLCRLRLTARDVDARWMCCAGRLLPPDARARVADVCCCILERGVVGFRDILHPQCCCRSLSLSYAYSYL